MANAPGQTRPETDATIADERHVETTYLLGRFMTEHLLRVHRLFDGDLAEAIVLATIAQHNVQGLYERISRSGEPGLDGMVTRGEHLPHLRPCNALSVSAATGIPRETVRRKVKRLLARGWIVAAERGGLRVAPNLHREFAEFDRETITRFEAAARDILRLSTRATSPVVP